MHSRYKDKHVLNHKLNSSIALILRPISKWPHKKKHPITFVVQFHILKRSFYSNLILAEWHKPHSEYHFLTDNPLFPFKQIALFSSLKLRQQDYRIKK